MIEKVHGCSVVFGKEGRLKQRTSLKLVLVLHQLAPLDNSGIKNCLEFLLTFGSRPTYLLQNHLDEICGRIHNRHNASDFLGPFLEDVAMYYTRAV